MKRTTFLAASAATAAISVVPLRARAAASDLVLKTPTGDLAGTLEYGGSGMGVPVVLIIAGSGPTDRDGNNPLLPGKNDSNKLLAQGLLARGVASLRYDKRGIAASAQAMRAESDLRFDDYVDDAVGWIGNLRTSKRFTRIVVAGHSEGSLIGMLAAVRGRADGYVSLEGGGRPAAAVLEGAQRAAGARRPGERDPRRALGRTDRRERGRLARGRLPAVGPAVPDLVVQIRSRARDREGSCAGRDRARDGRRADEPGGGRPAPRRAPVGALRRRRRDEPRPQARAGRLTGRVDRRLHEPRAPRRTGGHRRGRRRRPADVIQSPNEAL